MSAESVVTSEDKALVAEVRWLAASAHKAGALKRAVSAVLAEAMVLLELNRALFATLE